MGVTLEDKKVYAEVDDILNSLSDEKRNKVPLKLRETFKEYRDNEYIKKIDITRSIEEQNISRGALAIIALINLKYWCENDVEKEVLRNKYMKNNRNN